MTEIGQAEDFLAASVPTEIGLLVVAVVTWAVVAVVTWAVVADIEVVA
jgi:hypothetical protein